MAYMLTTNSPFSHTPANAARSIASAHRRIGTAAFSQKLEAQRTLTDPEAIAESEAQIEKEKTAYKRAREFVAQALVYPLLKEMRQSGDAWGPFAQGKHEKAFAWLIDERIASTIVDSKNFSVVDRVAESLLDRPVRLSAVLAERARDAASQVQAENGL